ncbi:MAG: energy transducer TonB [Rhodocyclaceae bacterium]|nr:energy transducer TonB [Rhodocyclaceae bacterium]
MAPPARGGLTVALAAVPAPAPDLVVAPAAEHSAAPAATVQSVPVATASATLALAEAPKPPVQGNISASKARSGAPNDAAAQPIPAIPIAEVAPTYPPDAYASGIGADVEVEVTIDETGRVTAARVVSSTAGDLFDEAARQAAYATRFMPARLRGVAVASTLTALMRFEAPQQTARY